MSAVTTSTSTRSSRIPTASAVVMGSILLVLLLLLPASSAWRVPSRTIRVPVPPAVPRFRSPFHYPTTTTTRRNLLFLPNRPAPTVIPSRRGMHWALESNNNNNGIEEEYPKFSSDVVASGSSNTPLAKSASSSSNHNNNATILQRLNDFGQSLKTRAQTADRASSTAQPTKIKIGLKLKASLLWMLYMGYRGYRGFFVILPAVFRETYRQLEGVVKLQVLDDDNDDTDSVETTALRPVALDINPATGQVRWRTRITVGILAALVTMTYVVGGLLRVLLKFGQTLVGTTSLSDSFGAAANEVEDNEGRLLKLSSTTTTTATTSTTLQKNSATVSEATIEESEIHSSPINGNVKEVTYDDEQGKIVEQPEEENDVEENETEDEIEKGDDPKKDDDPPKGKGGNLWSRTRKDLGF